MNRLIIRPLRPDETPDAMRLVAEAFQRHVAPCFSEEGIAEFSGFVTPQSALERCAQGHTFLGAFLDDQLAGMAESRDQSHICLLFVRDAHRRSGIGRELVRACVELCLAANPALERITVNASPNAVEAYRRFGFTPTAQERCHNGIRHVPMALKLAAPGKDT